MNTQIKVGDTVVRKKECQSDYFWLNIINKFKLIPAADVRLQVVQVWPESDSLALKYEGIELVSPTIKKSFVFNLSSFEVVHNYTVEEECDDC